ncbi:MAG: type II toxin-antitoxin system HicA family toxin [Acidimicrobiia bacterium]|nr:type II toxin-antitoxin system HicA family toxin [Acidimicrobiia bacterium]
MKRRDLVREIRVLADDANLEFGMVRQGAKHELWMLGTRRLVIPRHREINEYTARGIIKEAKDVCANG